MHSKCIRKGFTLTELMAVVIIVSILAGIAIGSYKKAVERSHFAEGLSAGAAVAEAVSRFDYENEGTSFETRRPKISQLDIGFENDRKCTQWTSDADYCFKTRYFEVIVLNSNRIQVNRVQGNSLKDYYFYFYPESRSRTAEQCCSRSQLGADLCKNMGYTSCSGSGSSVQCSKPL